MQWKAAGYERGKYWAQASDGTLKGFAPASLIDADLDAARKARDAWVASTKVKG